MFTLGLHNQGIIAFNLVTHIVYYDTTTEMGQSKCTCIPWHHYLRLGDILQLIAWP